MEFRENTTSYDNMSFSSGVTSVSGPDAKSFLQNLISADIDNLSSGNTQASLLLNPTGKTIAAFYIHNIDESTFLLVSEPHVQQDLIQMLTRLCIRTDAEIQDVSDKYHVAVGSNVDGILLDTNFYSNEGLNLYLVDNKNEDSDRENTGREAYEKFRIMNGAVNFREDLKDSSIAQEAKLEHHSISFNKGCFLGQELVCRIDSRGSKTPNTYFFIQAKKIGSDVSTDVNVNDEKLGEITSHYCDGNTCYLIAKLKRKAAELLENEEAKIEIDGLGDIQTSVVEGYFSI